MMIKLQVALDFIDLDKALNLAGKVASFCDILEAGTPLIKSCGLDSIRQLRKNFPGKEIFADFKTMDAGALETEMAFRAGAAFISVMAVSSDTTIKSALEMGNKLGIDIVFDLMGVEDKLCRAKTLEKMGAKFLHVHTGLDEQSQGQNPLQTLAKISRDTSVNLTVAGGINPNNLPEVLKVPGVSIVMVGSCVTKAVNPAEQAEKMYIMARKAGV